MRISIGVIGLVALSACTLEDVSPVVVDPPQSDITACGAPDLQYLVGQDVAAIAAMTFAQPMRLIRPGMAVTMDFSAERLNIQLDDAEKIVAVTCG